VIVAVLGAGVYLVFQAQNTLPPAARAWIAAQTTRTFAHPTLAFVARAGRGEPWPLAALVGLAGLFAARTTRLLGRMFISGVQEAGGVAPSRKVGAARRHVFVGGAARATFRKDLRLIIRDPLLLAQVLPTALYMLPALFVFSRFGGIGLLAPFALLLATQLSLALTGVAAGGEEGWDLIRMSPTREVRLRVAKMAAGCALPLALGAAMCAVLATLGRPWLALLSLVYSVGCAAAGSWLLVTAITPSPRRDILKRRRTGGATLERNIIIGALTLLNAGGLGLAANGLTLIAAIVLLVGAIAIIACFVLVHAEEIQPHKFSSATPGGGME
jgi:ABC-2 type transport system permease protein